MNIFPEFGTAVKSVSAGPAPFPSKHMGTEDA